MREFDYIAPGTLEEVLEVLSRHSGEARLLAGGTDLICQMKEGLVSPRVVISLGRVPALAGIAENGGSGLAIGALATLEEIATAPLVREQYGALAAAAGQVGSVQVRNRATIGGNLCNASPAADAAPPLLVLGATLVAASVRGERRVPVRGFFAGPNSTVLGEDEVLIEIRLPVPTSASGTAFLKLGRRKAMDIAIVSAAAYLAVEPGTATVREARVALGSAAPVPTLVDEVGEVVKGSELDGASLEEAGRVAAGRAEPISDIRASAEYRRQMVHVLVKRALLQAYAQATRAG